MIISRFVFVFLFVYILPLLLSKFKKSSHRSSCYGLESAFFYSKNCSYFMLITPFAFEHVNNVKHVKHFCYFKYAFNFRLNFSNFYSLEFQ